MKIALSQSVTKHHKMKNYRGYKELTVKDRRVPDPPAFCLCIS